MPTQFIYLTVAIFVVCAAGSLAGIWFERVRLNRVIAQILARQADLQRRLGERERECSEARADNKALSSFLVVLPDIVRHLNDNMSPRAIPPLLTGCLERLFEPAQILVFLTQGEGTLMLVHGKGLPGGIERGRSLPFGQGQIGMVALSQRAMGREEFMSESRFRRSEIEARQLAGIAVDLAAPMVSEGRTLGLIAVGGTGARHRDEKRMMKLVADLGALALVNQKKIFNLESTANRDSLTGLGAKGYLSRKLGELIHASRQSHAPLSVILFDIDHFKKLNDTHGHLSGDEILKKVASLLKQQVRDEDVAARYGGEEFVVVLPGTAKEDAVRIAEKIRSAIGEHTFELANGRTASVTISLGVAALMSDGASSHEILGAADQALYLAKEQGRNRVVTFRSRYFSDEDAAEAASGER